MLCDPTMILVQKWSRVPGFSKPATPSEPTLVGCGGDITISPGDVIATVARSSGWTGQKNHAAPHYSLSASLESTMQGKDKTRGQDTGHERS
jgi:hypothetical protein